MFYKIAPIILNSAKNSQLSCDVFVAQPDVTKEKLAGKLFIITTIHAERSKALKALNFIIDNINYGYYQNDKLLLREKIETITIENIFETVLTKANTNFKDFLNKERMHIQPSDIEITVGLLFENNIYFSNSGRNKAFLIYLDEKKSKNKDRNKFRNNSGEQSTESFYRIINIDSTTKDKSGKPDTSNKFFSTVISGSMPKKGYFFFTNEAVTEYIGENRLVDIISKLPPMSAAEQIKNILIKTNAQIPFLGTIIKNTYGLEKPTDVINVENKPRKATANSSINSLNSTKENTEKILMPSGIINLKIFIKKIRTKFKTKEDNTIVVVPKIINENLAHSSSDQYPLQNKIIFEKKRGMVMPKKIWGVVKDIIFMFLNIFFLIFRSITNKNKILSFFYSIFRIIGSFFIWIKNLSLSSKLLLGILLIVIVWLSTNLTFTHIENIKLEDEKQLAEIKRTIEQQQNQVESYLLYNDEQNALATLNKINENLNALEPDQEYQDFRKKYDELSTKLRHVIMINDPMLIANIGEFDPIANTASIKLSGGNLYVGDGQRQIIYKIDLGNNIISPINDLEIKNGSLLYPTIDKNNSLFFWSGNSILKESGDSITLQHIDINVPPRANISDMKIFSNNLYLLDSANNQIYRYQPNAGNYGESNNWIQETSDFSNASSISIDGQIYVLNKNGTILRYLKGLEREFQLDNIDPLMENASRLFVSNTTDKIFIMESKNKRIAVFNKDGKFLHQYMSDAFTDLRDFDVDEVDGKIFALSGNSIYQFPISK